MWHSLDLYLYSRYKCRLRNLSGGDDCIELVKQTNSKNQRLRYRTGRTEGGTDGHDYSRPSCVYGLDVLKSYNMLGIPARLIHQQNGTQETRCTLTVTKCTHLFDSCICSKICNCSERYSYLWYLIKSAVVASMDKLLVSVSTH